MAFLNPAFLWGLVAVAIPVLIHLYKKKNKRKLPWAATAFLSEKKPFSSKSFVPKDWLLLILRMGIFCLVCMALANPILGFFKNTSKTKVLFFEKDKLVQEEFKFEINQAINKKLVVFALNGNTEETIKSTDKWFNSSAFSQFELQKKLNQIARNYQNSDSIAVYIRPAFDFYDLPTLLVPQNMQIYWAIDPEKPKTAVWKAAGLYYSSLGRLSQFDEKLHKVVFEKDSLSVDVNIKDTLPNSFAGQAVAAIRKNMAYPIYVTESSKADIHLGDLKSNSQNLHIQTGAATNGLHETRNLLFNVSAPSTYGHADIRTGRYATLLLEQIQARIGLKPQASQASLHDLKSSIKYASQRYSDGGLLDPNYLWWCILILVLLERFISIYTGK